MRQHSHETRLLHAICLIKVLLPSAKATQAPDIQQISPTILPREHASLMLLHCRQREPMPKPAVFRKCLRSSSEQLRSV